MTDNIPNIVTEQEAQNAFKTILEYLGEDPTREGLQDTPKRWLKFMEQFLTPEPFNLTTFDSEKYDEIIIVKNIPFHSLCEHHIAPFMGTASIGYIPNDLIVGLSKLPRVLDMFARRLQNQERITKQVADYIMENLKPKAVGVVIEAKHLCVEMRGIKKHDCFTTTSAVRGLFKSDASAKNEFLNLIKK